MSKFLDENGLLYVLTNLVNSLKEKQDKLTISEAISSSSTNSTVAGSKAVYDYVTSAIAGVSRLTAEIVDKLPTTGVSNVLYLVPKSATQTGNAYDEYMWISAKWELIGATNVDLTPYLKKTDISDWAKASTKPTYTASEVGAATQSHTHTKSQITDFPTLGTAAAKNTDYFATAEHTHTAADVGAAAKSHTHTKSQITDFPTSLPANGGNADTVGGHTVGIDVPANAKFTDTTYSDATTSAHGLLSVADKKALDVLKSPFATCATARSTAAKVATLANFTLSVGATIAVKFTGTGTANPSSGNLTLNVNNTGAKNIGYFRNGNKSSLNYANGWGFYNNATHLFTYDGTYWLCTDWNTDNDTKITVDSALSSTSTNPVQNKVINSALAGKAASSHTHTVANISDLTAITNAEIDSIIAQAGG